MIPWYNNQEIRNLFALGYSSMRRRVAIMKPKIFEENETSKRNNLILQENDPLKGFKFYNNR